MDIKKSQLSLPQKALLALTIAGLASCGGKTAEEHLQEAQQYYRNNDTASAVIELKNALKENSKQADARALLGNIYLAKGQVADAEKELRRAIEYGVPFEQVALALAESILAQGQADKIIEDFAIEADDSDATIAIKSLILGESHIQNREYDAARQFLSSAAKSEGLRPKALLGQSILALIDRDFDTASTLIDEVLGSEPTNPKAWMTKADILLTSDDIEGGEAALNQVIEYAPSKSSSYYQRAMRQLIRVQLGRNDTDIAQATLDELKKSYAAQKLPGDLTLTLLRSTLSFQQQNFEAASELANQALMIDNNHLGAKLLIGLSDTRLGKYVQAETHLQHFLARVPEHDTARKALALVQSQTKNPEKALETLAPFNDKIDELDRETLTLMAQTSFLAGQSEQSTKLLQKALKKSPNDPKLNFALAQTLSAQSDYEQAIGVLQSLEGSTEQKQQALFTQAQIHIRSKEYDKALSIIGSLTSNLPDNPAPIALRGNVHLLQEDIDSARFDFKKAIELAPGYIPAIRALALIEYRNKNFEAAETAYTDALEQADAANERLIAQLTLDYSQLLLRQNKIVEAEEQLSLAQKNKFSELQSSILLARLYNAQNKPREAKEQLVEHQDRNVAAILAELGKSQMMLKEYNSALDSYRKLSLLEPNSPVPNYLVATAQLEIGDLKGADESLQQSLNLYGNYTPSAQTAVRLAIFQKDYERAREIANKFAEQSQDNNAVLLMKGDIAIAEKKPDAAAALYRELYAANPTDAVLTKLVGALTKAEGTESAIEFLTKESAAKPEQVAPHLLLANSLLSEGNNDAAIRSFEKVIELNEDQPIALNNLAWLLKETEPKRALGYAEKAHELVPNNSDIKDTLDTIKAMLN